jgi:hypothetical protein
MTINAESEAAFNATKYAHTEQQLKVLDVLRQHPNGLTRE